jgi:hypothetical protein
MKKVILISTFIFLCIMQVSAQLKVWEDGRVQVCSAVGPTTTRSIYIGSRPHHITPEIDNGEFTIEVLNSSGVFNICKDWPNDNWMNYLICIEPSNYNVGIGKLPSYKLDVDGDIATSGTFRQISDKRLKTNIKSLTTEQNKIYSLKAKSYAKFLPETNDLDMNKIKNIPDSVVKKKKHAAKKGTFEYGFIAQEVIDIYPELVTQNNDGYYAVNYIGLIPLMVEALKELKKENENLQKQIDKLKDNPKKSLRTINLEATDIYSLEATANTGALLYQNAPNPFNQSTQIKYYLPETVSIAFLCFYDLQGKQLKKITVLQRGEGSETILGSEFTPGIYLYALIADGQEVGVKRMILTE